MQRIIAFWNRGLIGKLVIGLVGLLLACCVIGVVSGPRAPQTTAPPAATTAPLVQVNPTRAPTEAPTPTPQLAVVVPAEATEAPMPLPTQAPAAVPKPTAAAQPAASGPSYHGTGSSQTVDPAWWPCQKGQNKGNRNSGIYHIPTGRSYAKTFKDVACFNTAAEAEAAGFRAAKN